MKYKIGKLNLAQEGYKQKWKIDLSPMGRIVNGLDLGLYHLFLMCKPIDDHHYYSYISIILGHTVFHSFRFRQSIKSLGVSNVKILKFLRENSN